VLAPPVLAPVNKRAVIGSIVRDVIHTDVATQSVKLTLIWANKNVDALVAIRTMLFVESTGPVNPIALVSIHHHNANITTAMTSNSVFFQRHKIHLVPAMSAQVMQIV
jgi:hypothetical protein